MVLIMNGLVIYVNSFLLYVMKKKISKNEQMYINMFYHFYSFHKAQEIQLVYPKLAYVFHLNGQRSKRDNSGIFEIFKLMELEEGITINICCVVINKNVWE